MSTDADADAHDGEARNRDRGDDDVYAGMFEQCWKDLSALSRACDKKPYRFCKPLHFLFTSAVTPLSAQQVDDSFGSDRPSSTWGVRLLSRARFSSLIIGHFKFGPSLHAWASACVERIFDCLTDPRFRLDIIDKTTTASSQKGAAAAGVMNERTRIGNRESKIDWRRFLILWRLLEHPFEHVFDYYVYCFGVYSSHCFHIACPNLHTKGAAFAAKIPSGNVVLGCVPVRALVEDIFSAGLKHTNTVRAIQDKVWGLIKDPESKDEDVGVHTHVFSYGQDNRRYRSHSHEKEVKAQATPGMPIEMLSLRHFVSILNALRDDGTLDKIQAVFWELQPPQRRIKFRREAAERSDKVVWERRAAIHQLHAIQHGILFEKKFRFREWMQYVAVQRLLNRGDRFWKKKQLRAVADYLLNLHRVRSIRDEKRRRARNWYYGHTLLFRRWFRATHREAEQRQWRRWHSAFYVQRIHTRYSVFDAFVVRWRTNHTYWYRMLEQADSLRSMMGWKFYFLRWREAARIMKKERRQAEINAQIMDYEMKEEEARLAKEKADREAEAARIAAEAAAIKAVEDEKQRQYRDYFDKHLHTMGEENTRKEQAAKRMVHKQAKEDKRQEKADKFWKTFRDNAEQNAEKEAKNYLRTGEGQKYISQKASDIFGSEPRDVRARIMSQNYHGQPESDFILKVAPIAGGATYVPFYYNEKTGERFNWEDLNTKVCKRISKADFLAQARIRGREKMEKSIKFEMKKYKKIRAAMTVQAAWRSKIALRNLRSLIQSIYCKRIDAGSGDLYYYNKISRKISYTRPLMFATGKTDWATGNKIYAEDVKQLAHYHIRHDSAGNPFYKYHDPERPHLDQNFSEKPPGLMLCGYCWVEPATLKCTSCALDATFNFSFCWECWDHYHRPHGQEILDYKRSCSEHEIALYHHEREEMEVKIQQCTVCSSIATSFCHACGECFCDRCSAAVHRKAGKENHTWTDL